MLTLYAVVRTPNPRHPLFDHATFGGLVRHLSVYLGSLLSHKAGHAMMVGWTAIAGSFGVVVVVVCWGRSEVRRDAAPWLMLLMYGFCDGVGTAVGRSAMGAPQALASRYGSLGAIFWLGLLGALVVLLREAAGKGRAAAVGRWAPVPMVAIVLALMYRRGVPELQYELDMAAQQPLSEQALRENIDDQAVLVTLSADPRSRPLDLRPWLMVKHQAPFDRAVCDRRGEHLDAARIAPVSAPAACTLNALERVEGRIFRLTGRLTDARAIAAEAVILDADNVIISDLAVGLSVPDGNVAYVPGSRAGIGGYVTLPAADASESGNDAGALTALPGLRVYVRLPGDSLFHPVMQAIEVAGE